MEPTTTPADAEIAAAIERIDALRPELEETRLAFVDAVTTWLPNWWQREVRRAITERPQVVTGRLGPAGIGKLKQKINQLSEEVEELVAKRLDDPDLWLHQQTLDQLERRAGQGPTSFAGAYTFRGSVSRAVEERLRLLCGLIGPFLVEAGLDRYHTESSVDESGPWRRPDDNHPPRYMFKLEVSPSVHSALVHYAQRCEDLFTAVADLLAARLRKARAEALRLWDDA